MVSAARIVAVGFALFVAMRGAGFARSVFFSEAAGGAGTKGAIGGGRRAGGRGRGGRWGGRAGRAPGSGCAGSRPAGRAQVRGGCKKETAGASQILRRREARGVPTADEFQASLKGLPQHRLRISRQGELMRERL